MGISYAPALDEMLYAEKGEGAFFNGKRCVVSDVSDLSAAYFAHGSVGRFQHIGKSENLFELCKNTRGQRGYGDYWGYQLVSQGKVDIMIDPQTKFWDVAAMACILKEAGGKMTDVFGKPLTRKIDSAIATNGLLHDEVVKIFS